MSVTSKRNVGTTISAGSLVYLPQYQQNFITAYCFSQFSSLLVSCISCTFEQITKKLIVYLRNLSIFFLSSLILGTFFWALITFERSFSVWIRPYLLLLLLLLLLLFLLSLFCMIIIIFIDILIIVIGINVFWLLFFTVNF